MIFLLHSGDDDAYDSYYDHDDGEDGDYHQPTKYTSDIYGDLELKIIETRGMVDGKGFFNYLVGREDSRISVDVDIHLDDRAVAASKPFPDLDHSTNQYGLQISLAHPVESEVRISLFFLLYIIICYSCILINL